VSRQDNKRHASCVHALTVPVHDRRWSVISVVAKWQVLPAQAGHLNDGEGTSEYA
jgi:hypothetical protein